MKTNSNSQPRTLDGSRIHLPTARFLCLALAMMTALFNTRTAIAANIVWVSDANDPAVGFFAAGGANFTDSGFLTMLQNAGHNVIRYNAPAGTVALTQAEIDALNTNDLIIIGRCVNSTTVQPPQGPQWNTNIIKPLIDMSPYHVRPDGNRIGWFTGGTLPDDTPTVLSAGDPADTAVDYLFAGVPMNGTNTALNYDELLDRNTSLIQNAPVAGAVVYATATFAAENNGAQTTAYAIVGFPAGTPVAAGRENLAAVKRRPARR
jgi:hypothetical protein